MHSRGRLCYQNGGATFPWYRRRPRLRECTAEGGCATIGKVKPPKITTNKLHITRRNLPHWQIGNSWFFVTFKTKNTELSPNARDIITDSLLHEHNKQYELALAVVMPDHVHMLLCPLEKEDNVYFSLAEIIQPIKGSTAHRINRLMQRKGAFWLSESFDRIIRDEEEWIEKYDYIKNNPVKAGIVDDLKKYLWLLDEENFVKKY